MKRNPHPPSIDHLTDLLNRGMSGESAANEQAFALVYDELRRDARRQMRRNMGAATLSPTGLVNEVYLKLKEGAPRAIIDRIHFYSLAARVMRQLLVDHQRGKLAVKRGGDIEHVELTVEPIGTEGNVLDYFALQQALDSLRKIDERAAQVVDLHFFSGRNFLEIAEMLEISDKTVRRDWESARAFLLLQMST